MKKPGIVVIDTNQEQCRQVCTLLSQLDYSATPLYSLDNLESHLRRHPSRVVILDLDTVAPDNQFFRSFKRKNRDIHILGISRLRHHPGLEEAMASHIYACLAKPLDQEELLYWLKSITENQSVARSRR